MDHQTQIIYEEFTQPSSGPVSKFLPDIHGIYDVVKNILEQYPSSRDSDALLLKLVWERQGITSTMSFDRVMLRLSAGKIASPESIRRSRQKIQKDYAHLRGELYNSRHHIKEIVTEVINNIS